jgi:hypothetical protein
MPEETPESFSWQAHPAAERRGAALAAAGLIVALAAAIWLSFGSPGWALFGIVVLVLALNRFFFRSRFRLDDEGITARFPLRTQRLGWANVRRFVVDEHGAYLSTRSVRSRFDAYRGLHVLLGRDRAAVITHIRTHLGEGARA